MRQKFIIYLFCILFCIFIPYDGYAKKGNWKLVIGGIVGIGIPFG